MKNIIYNCVDRVVLNVQLFMLYLMMIHLSDIHIIIHVGSFFMLYSFHLFFVMAGVERWWALVGSAPRPLLRRRMVRGLPFHTHLFAERCWTVWRHRRALLRQPRCPAGDEVRRREEVEHVVAGEEVG